MLKMIISLTILAVIIIPAKGGILLPNVNVAAALTPPNVNAIQNTVDSQSLTLASDQIKSLIQAVLTKFSVKSDEISINMDRTTSSCISIKQITITLSSAQMVEAAVISSTIKSELGLDVTIMAK